MAIDTHTLMGGIERFIVGGAIPTLKRVAWHDNDAAYTDGDTIHLPRPAYDWDEHTTLIWRYKCEHELGHEAAENSQPHWKDVTKTESDKLTRTIANILSDYVQERNRVGLGYAGRDDVLLRGRAAWLSSQPIGKATKLTTLFMWVETARTAWNPHLSVPAGMMLAGFVPAIEGVLPNIDVLRNEGDVMAAARKLRPLFDKEENSEDKDKSSAKGGDGEGDGVPMLDDHDAKAEGESASGDKDVKPAAGKAKRTSVEASGFKPRVPTYTQGERSHHCLVNTVANAGKSALPGRLRQWLVGRRQAKWNAGYRNGRLDTSRLSLVRQGREDVFRQKEEARMQDAAVMLLVDNSGSMAYSKYEAAVRAALMLADALSAAKASVRVETFSEAALREDSGETRPDWVPVHTVLKDWNERCVPEKMVGRAGYATKWMAENSDSESLAWVYHLLRQRQESKKLLVVISDGNPSAKGPLGRGRGILDHMRHVVNTIKADKTVKLVALGIGGHDATTWYADSAINIKNTDDLSGVLLDVAKAVWEN